MIYTNLISVIIISIFPLTLSDVVKNEATSTVPAAKPSKVSAFYIGDLLRTSESSAISDSQTSPPDALARRSQPDYGSYESSPHSGSELLPPLETVREAPPQGATDNVFEKFLFRQSGILQRNIMTAKKERPASSRISQTNFPLRKKGDCKKSDYDHGHDYEDGPLPERQTPTTFNSEPQERPTGKERPPAYYDNPSYDHSSHSAEEPPTYRLTSEPPKPKSRGSSKSTYSRSRSSSVSHTNTPKEQREKVHILNLNANGDDYDGADRQHARPYANTARPTPSDYHEETSYHYPNEKKSEERQHFAGYSRVSDRGFQRSKALGDQYSSGQHRSPQDSYEDSSHHEEYDNDRDRYHQGQLQQSKKYSDNSQRAHRAYTENSNARLQSHLKESKYPPRREEPLDRKLNTRIEYRDYSPVQYGQNKTKLHRQGLNRESVSAQPLRDQHEHSYSISHPSDRRTADAFRPPPSRLSQVERSSYDASLENAQAHATHEPISPVSRSVSFSESSYIDNRPTQTPAAKAHLHEIPQLKYSSHVPEEIDHPTPTAKQQTSYKPYNSEYPASYMVEHYNKAPRPSSQYAEQSPGLEPARNYEYGIKGGHEIQEPDAPQGQITGYREQYDESEPLHLDEDFFKKYQISNEAKIIIAKPMNSNLFVADGTRIQPGHGNGDVSKEEYSPPGSSDEESQYRTHGEVLEEAPLVFDEIVHSNNKFLANIPTDAKDSDKFVPRSSKNVKPRPPQHVKHETVLHHGNGQSRVLYHRRADDGKNDEAYKNQEFKPADKATTITKQ